MIICLFSGCINSEVNNSSKLSAIISGPDIGYINEEITFYGNAIDGKEPYSYSWDLDNDGFYDDANGSTIFFLKNNSYDIGTYIINLKVVDSLGEISFKNFTINIFEKEAEHNDTENRSPFTPDKPYGPTFGIINTIYSFSQSTIDPDDDRIRYRFDWGDGSFSEWSNLIEQGFSFSNNHSWDVIGTYYVKIIAEDSKGKASEWSQSLEIEIVDNGNIEITYPSIVYCYPYSGLETGLKPTLKIVVNWWDVPLNYKIPNTYLTWYTKNNGIWIEAKTIEIFSGGEYYYQFVDANTYSSTYYWKVRLFDNNGVTYNENSLSLITIQNLAPQVSSFSSYFGVFTELYPTITVDIYDYNGDKMDLAWYEKHDDVWVLTRLDQKLLNGTYSYKYESANEYGTDYNWKIIITDEYGFSSLPTIGWFRTKTPTITIEYIYPIDEAIVYVYFSQDRTAVRHSPLNFSATISNSEGHSMDIQFVYYSNSFGTIYNTTQNVVNGTYNWNPNQTLFYYGDSVWFIVKVMDTIWGKYEVKGRYNLHVKSAWIQLVKEGENSLNVTYIEPSDLSWDQIYIDGIGNKPSGNISVGDLITNCSDTIKVYWSEIGLLIGSWFF
jgi:hypothetical protein